MRKHGDVPKRNFHQIDNRLLPASASHHFMVWRHDSIMAALGCVLLMSAELAFSARVGRKDIGIVIITAIALPSGLSLWAGFYDPQPAAIYMAGTLMALAIFFVGLFAFRHLSGLIMMLLLSVLGLSLIAFWRMDQGGVWLVIGLITVALVDTMGYLVGRRLVVPSYGLLFVRPKHGVVLSAAWLSARFPY